MAKKGMARRVKLARARVVRAKCDKEIRGYEAKMLKTDDPEKLADLRLQILLCEERKTNQPVRAKNKS